MLKFSLLSATLLASAEGAALRSAASSLAPGPGPCGKENCGGGCPEPSYPPVPELPVVASLPDPFTFFNGSKVVTQDDWICRRAEIADLLGYYELGPKRPPPASTTGSVSATSIDVTAGDGQGNSISFTAAVTMPPAGVGSKPYPMIIGVGGCFLNTQALQNLGLVSINFNNNDIALQNDASSRGIGKYYDLYGKDDPAGALMAWAWGVSRLIDVIQADTSGLLDVNAIAVTGCSRNGKGALVVGAYDERIALTIPQESGSGGSASWRISDWQGPTVQTLEEITGENVWFTSDLANYNHNSTSLPFDHHVLQGMVAPRGLLVIENTGMVWLGNQSCWGNSVAGHTVFQALQVDDHMGVSQVGNHSHCQFPASQEPTVEAFVRKFLLSDASANTTIMYTDGGYNFNATMWQPWSVPILK